MADSYLRYFVPLPLQRPNPALIANPLHSAILDATLAYEGKYITLDDPWFPLKRPDLRLLREKIEREYRTVYKGETFQLLQRRTAAERRNSIHEGTL